MTREQYNAHKQRLEKQLQAGIQLLESAYQAQDRAVLYRILQDLRRDGVLEQESAGSGQRATIYRRSGGSHSPTSG